MEAAVTLPRCSLKMRLTTVSTSQSGENNLVGF